MGADAAMSNPLAIAEKDATKVKTLSKPNSSSYGHFRSMVVTTKLLHNGGNQAMVATPRQSKPLTLKTRVPNNHQISGQSLCPPQSRTAA